MGSEFTFYDYLDADTGGENVIHSFLNGQSKRVKAWANSMIRHLEESLHSTWSDPRYTKPLTGPWDGFFEIRKQGKNTRVRLVYKVEKRDVLLVATGFHKSKWEVSITPNQAKERVRQMTEHPESYRRPHDFK